MLFHPTAPLSERMRPTSLDTVVGQGHLIGPRGGLRKALAAGTLPSLILWGPPGVGKTTLANVIASQFRLPFVTLSAVSAGVKEVREVIDRARVSGKTILFIDEIHRFNKSQQDALLGAVEKGWVTLIGATTENPSFEVNAALLSRAQVYALQPLADADLVALLHRALAEDVQLKKRAINLAETEVLLQLAGGDARRLLNLLELVTDALPDPLLLTNDAVQQVSQQRTVRYDKTGEQHYDITSAFIKSIRGSDPNAAVYWLARMVEGGEDVKFIARRMLILAAEDVGMANPNALLLATSCFQAVAIIGYPEAEIILSQAAVYLATSPKSNASYRAIKDARALVRTHGDLPVPLPLRNAPAPLMKQAGYGAGYTYAHDFAGHFNPQEYLPNALTGAVLYTPGDNPAENKLRAHLRQLWGDKYGY